MTATRSIGDKRKNPLLLTDIVIRISATDKLLERSLLDVTLRPIHLICCAVTAHRCVHPSARCDRLVGNVDKISMKLICETFYHYRPPSHVM